MSRLDRAYELRERVHSAARNFARAAWDTGRSGAALSDAEDFAARNFYAALQRLVDFAALDDEAATKDEYEAGVVASLQRTSDFYAQHPRGLRAEP